MAMARGCADVEACRMSTSVRDGDGCSNGYMARSSGRWCCFSFMLTRLWLCTFIYISASCFIGRGVCMLPCVMRVGGVQRNDCICLLVLLLLLGSEVKMQNVKEPGMVENIYRLDI